MVTQGLELSKNPHILVATPGRLADHLESCDTFSLARIKFLVLDEADRLLGGHFDDQIKTIFNALPKQKQILLFSATMTDTLDKVKLVASSKVQIIMEIDIGCCWKMPDYIYIYIYIQKLFLKVFMWESNDDTGVATVKELDQRYVLCPSDVRDSFLVEVVKTFRSSNKDGSIMIFTDTCK